MNSDGPVSWMLAIAVIAAAVLIWGGIKLIVGKTERQKGWLMLGAALVLIANVAILAF